MRRTSRFDHELSQALVQLDRHECHGALSSLITAFKHYGKDTLHKQERGDRVKKAFTAKCIRR